MQNWNQWQLPAGAVTTPIPQPPVGYAAAATAAVPPADPTALEQSYMQYYNQPAPSGYTPEQWAAAQQQSWAQWQQWQQQYQQWQAQYGDKYQETMKHHMSAVQNVNLVASQVQPPPPLPKEDIARPPLPPTTASIVHQQFTNMPPPHQNNLPLFPAKESATTSVLPPASATNYPPPNHQQPPPLPDMSQQQQQLPPLPSEIENKRGELPGGTVGQAEKRDSNVSAIGAGSESNSGSSAKKLKLDEDEELTDAEKTFDAQFKQWEEQFNKWKQQNANHPDKTQYKQYEAKWTSWREKLLERREQMRKKREQQKQAAAAKAAAAAVAEADKSKSTVSGDEKILNILSNTENQRLINNLLGIGKSLGLTGKQQTVPASTPPSLPPPPPPPPETANSGNQPGNAVQGVQSLPQPNIGSNAAPPPPPPSSSSSSSSSWQPNQQQWENSQQLYNPLMESAAFGMPFSMHHHLAPPFAHPMTSPNFTQPPPSLPGSNNGPPPNFSLPPPNYPPNNNNNNNQERPVALQGAQDQPPNVDAMRFPPRHPNDRGGNFDGGQQPNFLRRPGEPSDHRFPAGRAEGIANPAGNEQEQFLRPGDAAFSRSNEPFTDRIEQQRFRRGDRSFPGDFGNNSPNGPIPNFHPGNDNPGRFVPPINERFAGGNNRFGGPVGNERFPPPSDRPFAQDHDRFGGLDRFSGGERFVGPEADRFARGKEHRFDRPDNERFGPNDRFPERFPDLKDRFPPTNDRFGTGVNEHFGSNDRFGRSNNPADCFDPNDANDHRRDSFGNNSRVFGRNPGFSPPKELPPELRKLMEKRKAAGDVFRPSFLSDSEKTSSVGSLSESFKKIAGDSPFRSSFDFPKTRPGPTSVGGSFPSTVGGRSTPSPFQPHSFAPDSTAPPYGHHPRGGGGLPFNSNNNEPPASLIPAFRQAPFSDNFAKHGGPANYNERGMEKDVENNLPTPNQQQAQPADIQPQSSAEYHPGNTGVNVDPSNNLETDNGPNTKNVEVTQPTNETDNATVEPKDDPVIEDASSRKSDDNREGVPESVNDSSFQQQQQHADKEQDNSCEEKENAESNTGNENESVPPKKPESLPFMDENDPRPEDLNIEPPPELPNLGPVLTSPESEPQNIARPFNEASDGKGPPAGGVQLQDIRSRGIEFPKMGTTFRFPGPPPLFPRGPHAFPPPRYGGNPQLGPNDEQFGSNAPGDAGRFSPGRSEDEQYTERDRADESPGENPQHPNSGQFGPMNEPFGGPRGPIGKFGQIGPGRVAFDSPFAPRNPGPFGPRGNMPFGARGGSGDTLRHPSDGPQFSFLGPNNNNNRFGRPNEPSFDSRRPPFGFPDVRPNEGPGFGLRGPNSSMLGGPRGPPPDTFTQGRSPKAFNENRFDSRDFKESGPFGADLKDRPLAARGPMGDPSYTRDYAHRSGPFAKKEPFLDDKRQFGGSPAARSDESFDRNATDAEPQKDIVEYTRRMPQDPYKKDSDDNRARGKFNDDQAQCTTSTERNQANAAQFDERTDPDRQSKLQSSPSSNLFTKRPQSMLSAGSGGGSPGEFCAPRQFNYNHGETSEKVVEYTPSKVIDYGHVSRPAVIDQHLSSPVQCFDYSHGDSKPVEYPWDQPKRDLKNWVENEQSIKDYAEQMRICHENARKEYTGEKARSGGGYDNYEKSSYATRKPDYAKQRMVKEHHMDWQQQQQTSDRRSCGERRESEDRKERSYNSLEDPRLFFERDSSAIDGQGDRNVRRERPQETCETPRRETNKDSDKDDSSLLDTKKNVESTTVPKTLELAKIPNCTMVDDLLCPPGRQSRPPKIAIILRGPPGSGKSFVAKLIKDKEVEQGGSAPRILSLDDYFLVEKEIETKDDNGKKVTVKEMVYEYEEAMEQSYITSLVKAFKKNITDGFFNFIILDCINEKISDYEEMWSFAKTKGFKVYVCEMEMDLQICLKRNIHNRTEDEINRIIDYFEPTPSYHLKLDVNSMLQEQAIEEVDMEDSQQEIEEKSATQNEDSQDSQEDTQDAIGVSKWEQMEAENKLDRLDGLARKKETRPQTMEDFLQVPDYYNMEDTSGKKRVRWADLEERKEQEKMRAVGFVVGHTNWDRMMDPTQGESALTRTKYI
ncbi:PREDICTED: uncharacterized protein LOC106740650 isoform X2 [Dinoponera quadriceps]|uniref:YLP motif-containing protein 1 n=1 Tax=Dinoponera quadriceps TaxID=609295 RepID=A0A6P3WNN5_DINQU|nr:PREDICTED: uncharacterized protein LOC106740650 isoform X2 [Dinoponera quadriceps]